MLCIMVGLGVRVMATRNGIDSDPLSSRTQPPSLVVDNGLDQIVPESETNIDSRIEGGEKKALTANRTAAIDESLSTQRLDTGLYLYVQQTYVTLHAVDQSLKTVLDDLARETGIQINTELIADRRLTIRLDRLPVDRALRAILDSDDSFFAFEDQGGAPSALKAVWVLPAGMGGNWLPSAATGSQDIAALERQLTAQEASQRAEAIETWIDRQGPEAVPAVVQSLTDQDDDVRYRALSKANYSGLVLPPDMLADLVEHDPSAPVRMMAIDAIGNHPSIEEQDKKAFARLGVGDSDAAVQTRASEILSHLETAPLILEQEQASYTNDKQETFYELPEENVTEGTE